MASVVNAVIDGFNTACKFGTIESSAFREFGFSLLGRRQCLFGD